MDYETIDPEVIMEVGEFSYEIPLNVIPDAEVEDRNGDHRIHLRQPLRRLVCAQQPHHSGLRADELQYENP